jgi:uncharacterized membrane protein YjjP (DUF1212 family)
MSGLAIPSQRAESRAVGDAAGRNRLVLMAQVAGLLLTNGQTTEGTRVAVERLGNALERPSRFTVRWGELMVWADDDPGGSHQVAEPLAIDISRVVATERLVDDVCLGRLDATEALPLLHAIGRMPPVSAVRFVIMAAAGAAALGIIFGAADALTIGIIAASAAAGACVRRAIAHISRNPFAQPFLAALLAGGIGSAATALALPVSYRLVAVCPCMVLVPGPHFLNGMIDLARARIPLGASRLAFASLVAVAISTGLLVGLSATTTSLPGDRATLPVPLAYDVCAAGIAVAAYGSFFNMPWRMIPIPIGIGMCAHALHWELLRTGASVQFSAFVACLVVGTIMTLVSHRLRMPFGALAFASVVSLIPGVFMFQTASEVLDLTNLDASMSLPSLTGIVRDGATAALILLAMASGLIIPKMCLDSQGSTGATRSG